MKAALFDYMLPAELIASHPAKRRDGSRLIVVDPESGQITHSRMEDLASHLPPGSLLAANDTRVIPARLRAHRPTGGAVEVLFVRPVDGDERSCRWTALVRANKPLKVGDPIDLGSGLGARVERKFERGQVDLVVDRAQTELRDHLEMHGEVPLPPYIKRAPVIEDRERYQTVYARHDGSVAAPTAGLHFTPELIDAVGEVGCEVCYVTLHVGPGTFRPITAENLEDHEMDEEHFSISASTATTVNDRIASCRPIIAVGTTVVRTLEGSFARNGRLEESDGSTRIFISPPFEFRVVNGLLTNFHLPRSTLLCLVSALAGRELVMAAYEEAVSRRYRFYSYGDAMLILPRKR